MAGTILLYYEDPYMQSFESSILRCVDIDNTLVGLVLDRTCFFPHSGGAFGDIGFVNDSKVFEVTIERATGVILHPISKQDSKKLQIEMRVMCHIDWDRRYRIMKLHAASHIMEHYLFTLVPEIRLLGTNVNENRDSSTYDAPGRISDEIINKLNILANEFIAAGYPITTYPDKDRSGFRIWECNGICIPCGGVHPKNTSEIGAISIKRKGGGNRQEIRTELSSA